MLLGGLWSTLMTSSKSYAVVKLARAEVKFNEFEIEFY